ncbi:histidine kinase like sensor protein [Chondrocystis sp. NIES-4102]|nr:histidine kinase like sensor protein [Chondrocystis sp. NIES-4102]
MESYEQSFASPDLESVIDRNPLIISPDIPIIEAIALMSRARGVSCQIRSANHQSEFSFSHSHISSCALVMANSKLVGILTERDIVRFTAEGLCLESVKVNEVMTQPVVTLLQSNLKDVFAALFLFRRYRIRHLPIIDGTGQLVGVISPETIRQAMRPANLLKLRRVADVMSRNLIHTSADTSVLKIAQLMACERVSCVVITQANLEADISTPIGIITERDILQFQFLQAKLDNLTAQQVMSSPLFLLSPEDSLLMAHQEMQHRKVRRLVVSWNWGRGLGIVTQTSILRIFDPMEMYGVIETLQRTVQQLEQEKADLLAMIDKN